MLNKILVIFFIYSFCFGKIAETFACTVCYGSKGSSMTSGLNMAIISLLMILLGVLSCVGVFFRKVGKRIKMLEH